MPTIGEAIIDLKTGLANFKAGLSEAKSELNNLGSVVRESSENFKSTGKSISGFVVTLGDVWNIASKVTDVMMSVVRASAENEFTAKKLADAMKDQNVYTKEAYQRNIDYASSLQKVTVYSDEEIKTIMQLLTQMGLHDEKLRSATKAATNLASALNIDLGTAARLIGRAFEGHTEMLGKYGIAIDKTKSKTEQYNAIIDRYTKGSKAAEGETETFNGKLKVLENSFDEFKETVGAKVLPVLTKLLDITNKLFNPVQVNTQVLIDDLKRQVLYYEKDIEVLERDKQSKWRNQEAIARSIEWDKKKIESLKDMIWMQEESIKTSKKEADEFGKKSNSEIASDLARRSAMEENMRQEMMVRGEENKKYDSDMMALLVRTNKMTLAEERKALSMKLMLAKQGTQEEKELILQLANLDFQITQKRIQNAQSLVNSVSALTTNLMTLESTAIQSNLQEKLLASQTDYDSKKATLDKWLEDNLASAETQGLTEDELAKKKTEINEEYNTKLKELDEDKSKREKTMNDKATAEERKRKEDMKPILIAQAIANTAVGVTKAIAEGGIFGIATGALVAVAGAAQVAIINAQKFQKGTRNFKGGWAVVGDVDGGGGELMHLPQGTDIFSNKESREILSQQETSVINFGTTNITINGNVDKQNIDDILSKITKAVKSSKLEAVKMVKAITKEGGFHSGEAY